MPANEGLVGAWPFSISDALSGDASDVSGRTLASVSGGSLFVRCRSGDDFSLMVEDTELDEEAIIISSTDLER